MITNNPSIGKYVIENGVDKVFIDLEKLGKDTRQGHLDTWKSNHSKDDILSMRKEIKGKKILVRLNPWNNNSINEINIAIDYGADFLMLPMIVEFEDITKFCKVVNSRVPVIPLIETRESLSCLDKIIDLDGVSEIHIGLNDLSLSFGYKFLFEPLVNGVLDNVASLLNSNNIIWGFGGIAKIGNGILPAELILGEHVRLNSTRVILSRSFYNSQESIFNEMSQNNFSREINKLNEVYNTWLSESEERLEKNHKEIRKILKSLSD